MRAARKLGVGIAASALIATAATPVAFADGHESADPITVIATGLDGPRQISSNWSGTRLFVAENDTGEVSAVQLSTGAVTSVLTDLGTGVTQGVDWKGGKLYVAVGEPGPDDSGAPMPPPPANGYSALLGGTPGGTPELLADLLAYELANNPDGQAQFGPDGAPVDALSNPYYVLASENGNAMVADAGGNDIILRSANGDLETYAVLPVITTGPCAGFEQNDPGEFGCDAVPTGMAYGYDNDLYVSALSGFAPGEGRVYVYDKWSRTLIDEISGLNAPTGVAVDADGNVYVSELLEGAPEGEGPPPPGFDPSTVGQIVKIAPNGDRSYAQVTMPAGLLIKAGKLYASAWSVAGLFLGIPEAGQIVQVGDAAFVPAAGSGGS